MEDLLQRVGAAFSKKDVTLDATLLGDALWAEARAVLITDDALRLSGCRLIETGPDRLIAEGRTKDLRGHRSDAAITVQLLLLGGEVPLLSLVVLGEAAAVADAADALVADFDAELDVVLPQLALAPVLVFCSREASRAEVAPCLPSEWPEAHAPGPGVNLLLQPTVPEALMQDIGDIVREILPRGVGGTALPARVHRHDDGLSDYWALDDHGLAQAREMLLLDEGDGDEDEGDSSDGQSEPETLKSGSKKTGDAAILPGDSPTEPSDRLVALTIHLKPLDATFGLPGLQARLDGAALSLQLGGPHHVGSEAALSLVLGHDEDNAGGGMEDLSLTARVNLLTGTVLLRLERLPSVDDVLQAVVRIAGGGADPVFDRKTMGPLGGLLDAALEDAWILVRAFDPEPGGETERGPATRLMEGGEKIHLDTSFSEEEDDEDEDEDPNILSLGFLVKTKKPIDVVPGLCKFQPSARLRMDRPLSGDRRLVGLLRGSLEVGRVLNIEAELLLPSGDFAAAATVSLKEVRDAFSLEETPWSEVLNNHKVELSVTGNIAQRVVVAEFKLSESAEWSQEIAGRDVQLQEVRLSLAHNGGDAEDETSIYVSAALNIPHEGSRNSTPFRVAGGWDGGWYLIGTMDGELDLAEAARQLVPGVPVPDSERSLVLADLFVSADFRGKGRYTIRGRSEGDWYPIPSVDLSFAVDTVELLLAADSETSANIVCRASIVRREIGFAAKKDGGAKGWTFTGRIMSEIDISELADDIDRLLGCNVAEQVPEGFRVTDLQISFETADKRFEFRLAGSLKVDDTEITGFIRIITQHGKERSTTVDGGLDVGDVHVAGRFFSNEEARLFAGALALEGKARHFDLTDATSAILGEAGAKIPELSLDVKELTFLWRHPVAAKPEQPKSDGDGFLIDLALGMKIALDLREVLPIGASLGIPSIALEELRARYASAGFKPETVASINALLLEEGDDGRGIGIGKDEIEPGVSVTARLAVGSGEALPVSLAPSREAEPGDVGGREKRATTKETPAGDASKWICVDKSLGPLHVGRIGFNWKDGKVGVLLDSGIDLAGLSVGLSGFGLYFPLTPPPRPEIGLDGLDLSYSGGPISISGAFLRSEGQTPDSGEPIVTYDGMALINAANFSISGFGSYGSIDSMPSMFVYAALLAELGGPPFFRVRGLAAGFGYNRKLTLPKVEAVRDFPLVRAAIDPDYLAGGDSGVVVRKAMGALAQYIMPSPGDYWVAAGLRFNSFELIDAFALASVSFGHDVEIGLLGLAKMSLPRGAKEGREVAFAELAMRASIKPEEGTVLVEGRLTENSFVLTKSCRLKGGFALMFWFSGQHEGDFVVTFGGYHPRFRKPDHYPVVPRLGIQWEMTPEVTVTSEMYFALTPSCVMAGGKLAAVYRSGPVRAWFTAYVDFLLNWEPLYYTAEMGVTIGVEADLALGTLCVSRGVDLKLWGPSFGGVMTVDLDVISIGIRFGSSHAPPLPLKPSEFEAAFLPDPENVVTARVGAGLAREESSEKSSGGRTLRVVNSHRLKLTVQSLVPIEEAEFTTATAETASVSISAVSTSGDEAFAPGETGTVRVDASFADSTDGLEVHTVTVTVPQGFTVTDLDGGTQVGDEISWSTTEPNFQVVLQVEADDPLPGEQLADWQAEAKAVESEDQPALLGVSPMASSTLGSRMTLCLRYYKDGKEIPADTSFLRTKAILGKVPAALWRPTAVVETPRSPPNEQQMTLSACVGLSIETLPVEPEGSLERIALAVFSYSDLPGRTIPPFFRPESHDVADGGIAEIMTTKVTRQRDAILAVLSRDAPFALYTSNLAKLVEDDANYFQATVIAPCPLGAKGEGVTA